MILSIKIFFRQLNINERKPLACHGDVVKETVELLINNEVEFDKKLQEARSVKSKMKP